MDDAPEGAGPRTSAAPEPPTDPATTPPGAAGTDAAGRVRAGLPSAFAAFVVFVSAAAVLVLEILALRLIAPYVGVTLQTNTAVIGSALLPSRSARGPAGGSPTAPTRAG